MAEKDIISLSTPAEELENKLLHETDVDQLQDIINIFNLNIKRKDILRTSKLSELQDLIYNQIDTRVRTNPDAFSNKDLLDYFKTVQETINKTDKTLTSVDIGSIQINQNQLNVTEDKLTRESRAKILNAVNSILNKAKSEPIEAEFNEVKGEDICQE